MYRRNDEHGNDPFPIADGDGRFGIVRRMHDDRMIDDAILGEEHAAFSGTVEMSFVGLAVSARTLRVVTSSPRGRLHTGLCLLRALRN